MDKDIVKLQIDMAQIQENIAYIKDSVKQNALDHKEIIQKVDNLVSAMDTKYAPRVAWTIMIWAGSIVGGSIILGIIALLARLYKLY